MKNFIFILSLYCFTIISNSDAAPPKPAEIENVTIEEKLGQQIDLNLKFKDESGNLVTLKDVVNGRKPTLLYMVYYNCPGLCNFFLNGSLEVMKKLPLVPGRDYNILTVTIDPREDSELAKGKRESYYEVFGRPIENNGWYFWVNDKELEKIPSEYELPKVKEASASLTSVRALADQVGFRYRYDRKADQFAHAAGMMVLTPDGRVSRYLHGISFQARDLRLALAEASGGKIGNVVDRFLLFCYHYDPKAKGYTLFAANLMRVAAGLTVLAIMLGIAFLSFKRKKVEMLYAQKNKKYFTKFERVVTILKRLSPEVHYV